MNGMTGEPRAQRMTSGWGTTTGVHALFPWVRMVAVLVALCGAPGCGESVRVVQLGGDASSDGGDLGPPQWPQPPASDAAAYACPGGHGCACTADADCSQSGLCLDLANGKACAAPCTEGYCPSGAVCRPVQGVGGSWCVAAAGRVCDPCATDSDCAERGHDGAACVDYGAAGRFCGTACASDGDCGSGYQCRQVPSSSGATVRQCVRSGSQPASLGLCSCSSRAIAQKLQTVCGSGSCTGTRACGDSGLSDCSAAKPQAEVCNGADDDCDGQTDENAGGALCDDGKPCTADTCGGSEGCKSAPLEGPCDADGSVCTTGDSCQGGVCVAGAALVCDDGNPCSDDGCDKAQGCVATWPAGKPCDDGNSCTSSDACSGGHCKGGSVQGCDDGDACTADSCDPSTGCVHQPASGGPCSDGDACTGADTCAGGQCSGQAVSCDDSNPCTQDGCDAVTGCTTTPASGPCEDGDLCTSGEQCAGGKCSGGVAKSCSGSGPCVISACQASSGQCTDKLRIDGTACSDGKACTVLDTCQKGACVGKLSCDDKDPCTADLCGVNGACSSVAIWTGSCQPAACKGIDCDDKNPCTVDGCDAGGCTHIAATGVACDDGSACSVGDACTANGKCLGAAIICHDDNPCTDDACSDQAGCTFLLGNGPCDTGSCKAGQCAAGKCVPTGQDGCDDGNPCTTDSCVNGKCSYVALEDGSACDDGSLCSSGDTCNGGSCGGKPVVCAGGSACASASCDPQSGSCVTKPETNGTLCDDGDACTGSDACLSGACKGAAKSCDDQNPCTTDSCTAGVCGSSATSGPCDDGNACTSGESCSGGTCSGVALSCDDKNPCTVDSCDPTQGCIAKPGSDGVSCDDGDVCTLGDLCSGGKCLGKLADDAVTTLAGAGVSGSGDGKGLLAKFTLPLAIAADADGVLYIADGADSGPRIRKMAADGTVTTLAGSLKGFGDGAALTAKFWGPSGIAVAADGSVYVADRYNQRIRKISGNTVSTLAGSAPEPGFFDNKAEGAFADGQGAAARFDEPSGLALGPDGKLYVVEAANHRVRRVSMDGTVETLAGSASAGKTDGPAAQAQFKGPTAVAVASNGDVFVADTGNHLIRKISAGVVSTVAGDGIAGKVDGALGQARFSAPAGLAVSPDGTLVVADAGNHVIRAVSADAVSTLAGTGVATYLDGLPAAAAFNGAQGIVRTAAGTWAVADSANFRVRRLFVAKLACVP
jgi:DNA-binding beta-propeller fold protein YncE